MKRNNKINCPKRKRKTKCSTELVKPCFVPDINITFISYYDNVALKYTKIAIPVQYASKFKFDDLTTLQILSELTRIAMQSSATKVNVTL